MKTLTLALLLFASCGPSMTEQEKAAWNEQRKKDETDYDAKLYIDTKRKLLETIQSEWVSSEGKKEAADALLKIMIAHGEVQIPSGFVLGK